jgi:hypothetical protein
MTEVRLYLRFQEADFRRRSPSTGAVPAAIPSPDVMSGTKRHHRLDLPTANAFHTIARHARVVNPHGAGSYAAAVRGVDRQLGEPTRASLAWRAARLLNCKQPFAGKRLPMGDPWSAT